MWFFLQALSGLLKIAFSVLRSFAKMLIYKAKLSFSSIASFEKSNF